MRSKFNSKLALLLVILSLGVIETIRVSYRKGVIEGCKNALAMTLPAEINFEEFRETACKASAPRKFDLIGIFSNFLQK